MLKKLFITAAAAAGMVVPLAGAAWADPGTDQGSITQPATPIEHISSHIPDSTAQRLTRNSDQLQTRMNAQERAIDAVTDAAKSGTRDRSRSVLDAVQQLVDTVRKTNPCLGDGCSEG